MSTRTDPFTRTPGVAGKAYIDSGIADEIISNFCSAESSKYVYKITGLRGSGKSVEYSKVIHALMVRDDWCVYTLSASGEAVKTLISRLSAESFVDSQKKSTSVSSATSIGGDAFIISGDETISVERTESDDERYYSDEAALFKMVKLANQKGLNVLIGIDDISKTAELIKLLSIVGAMQLEGLQLYLLVTGLSENIEEF